MIRVKPVGTKLEIDDNLATVEAGKRIATFPTPLSGTVHEISGEVIKNPQLINERPYTYWIAKVKATKPEELKLLKRAEGGCGGGEEGYNRGGYRLLQAQRVGRGW